MRPPKLSAEDIPSLRGLLRSARLLEQGDLSLDEWPIWHEKRASILASIRSQEQMATANALHWWANVPSETLRAELKRWHEAYRWEHTRSGWRAYRLIKNRMVYASRPCQTGAQGPRPNAEFIRI